jgi:hypothetical protein
VPVKGRPGRELPEPSAADDGRRQIIFIYFVIETLFCLLVEKRGLWLEGRLREKTVTDEPSEDLLRAIAASPSQIPADKLDALRAMAAELRAVELEISDLESRVGELKSRRSDIITSDMVELFDAARVPAIELAAEGNFPAKRYEIRPYYAAGISAKWPEEKRRAAYSWLEANGAGDLIKTHIEISFPREDRKRALDFLAGVRKMGIDAEVSESVHTQTLTAWLRETVEGGGDVPPLDVIGGSIGRTVKIVPIKAK